MDMWYQETTLYYLVTCHYIYLIDTVWEYTKSKANMKAYQSLEAYDMFQDKHVQDCFFSQNVNPMQQYMH